MPLFEPTVKFGIEVVNSRSNTSEPDIRNNTFRPCAARFAGGTDLFLKIAVITATSNDNDAMKKVDTRELSGMLTSTFQN